MVARLRDAGSDASPTVTVHLALAMIWKSRELLWISAAAGATGRKEGTSLTDIKKAFNAACDRAAIKDFRFHDLRHTFGTRAADAGESLTNIADVMGHANIHTTMRYAHATDAGRRRAVEAVENHLRDSNGENVVSFPSSGTTG